MKNDGWTSAMESMADLTTLSFASKALLIYGGLMGLALGLTYWVSLSDARTLRDVGIWVKPMKFMAATALFVWTTVWLSEWANPAVAQGEAYKGNRASAQTTEVMASTQRPIKYLNERMVISKS